MSAPVERPPRVAVVGAGRAGPEEERLAEALGAELGRRGAVLICGGRTGVMAAAARGAAGEGGLTVGLLPGSDDREANPWIRIPLATGLGQARNAVVVSGARAVVAVGGSWGTLSEIALARKMGRPVALLGPGPLDHTGLEAFDRPEDAARWAVEQAGGPPPPAS